MSRHLVIAGGGHAHLTMLARLDEFIDRGHRVTVIGPSDYHYYSGMGPGMLGGTYRPEEIRFATKKLTEKLGGRFVRGEVVGIDPDGQSVALDSGEQIPYDVLSCNLGSHVPEGVVDGELEDIFLVKPIERLEAARKRIIERGSVQDIRVGIVGGGPSAVEIAGNVWRIGRQPGMKQLSITVHAGSGLLPHHPSGVGRKARKSLLSRGIAIDDGGRVASIRSGRISDAAGVEHRYDIIFVAVGVRPPPLFAAADLPVGADGGMLVNEYLQSVSHHNIFGGGDCISFQRRPLDKVGVFAVRENPVLMHNVMAALDGTGMTPFEPGGDYLLIFNLGDDTGIFYKWSILFGGRLAFRIKDWIDRRFMREFQQYEQ